MTRITQAEFARQQGWAKSYITKLKHEGRLVLHADGSVDAAASLARIKATAAATRPDAAARAATLRSAGADLFTAPVHAVNAPALSGIEGATPGDAGAQLRRVRELMIREQRVIELGRLRGELLERADVERAFAALGTTLRAGIEASVERLAPVLSGAPDRATIAALTRAELRAQARRFTRALVAAARASARAAA